MSKDKTVVSVETFGRFGSIPIDIIGSVSNNDVFIALCKRLKLKDQSQHCFALYAGRLGQPTRKLKGKDKFSTDSSGLCLQRSGLDLKKELKTIKLDDIAIHLLYSEASYYLSHPISKLVPTADQRQSLDEFSDPQFPTERQFLETAMSVEGYTAMQALDCILKIELTHKDTTIPANTAVTCTCYEKTFQIMDQKNNNTAKWDWKSVRRWKLTSINSACFETCNEMGTATILQWFEIETQQAPLLTTSALEVCTHKFYTMHPDKKPVDAPDKPTSLTERLFDPLQEYLNSAFESEPSFSKID
jgi:hypothetical protein